VLRSIKYLYHIVKERKTRYRSRSDIVATILQSAAHYRQGIGLTKIMYISFLSYLQADKYMQALTENSLLSFDDGQRKYKITAKGHQYLELYRKMNDMIKDDGN
jgi:predicted transcriptional regulator